MIQLISSKIVPLTRELAEDFATMRAVPGERPLTATRVQMLRNRFDDGLFHTPEWAAASVGGIRYRVNGQHSSGMLLGLNGHFPKNLSVHVMEYAADGVEELPTLFAQFDAKSSARTAADIVNSHARVHAELDDVSATVIHRVVAGIAWAENATSRIDANERAQLVHSHQDFILWASDFVVNRKLQRAPVIAAMRDTWKKDAAASVEFWAMVRDESHPEVDHPSRIIASFLRDYIGSQAAGSTRGRYSPDAFYAKCIHAWNAYRSGQSTGLKYHPTAKLPTPI